EIKYYTKIACGPISSEIVRIAEVEGFDVIVIGTRGLAGLKRMLMGSVAEDVVRHAHCPVIVVR
ncbi:MAG: universal stress protein, partial [Thermodesulfobacteriota bacterium]|nr:universal stress protein [Thermodesulfobacteriota bacterium]